MCDDSDYEEVNSMSFKELMTLHKDVLEITRSNALALEKKMSSSPKPPNILYTAKGVQLSRKTNWNSCKRCWNNLHGGSGDNNVCTYSPREVPFKEMYLRPEELLRSLGKFQE
nr:9905_t:CDS:2 [Entrophospora candida]